MTEQFLPEELRGTKEYSIFRNSSGLVVFRRGVHPDTSDVTRHGIVIFTGNESISAKILGDELNTFYASSDLQHFVAPWGCLPVYTSTLDMKELITQAVNGVGRFQYEHGKIIITEIPWEKLIDHEIELSVHPPTLLLGETPQDSMERLMPESVKGGHILKRTRNTPVNIGLTSHFNSRNVLTGPGGEYLLATPSRDIHEITSVLQSCRLAFIEPRSERTPGQIIYSSNL